MTSSSPTQIPLFIPVCEWQPPEMTDLPDWSKAKRVAIDTETCDPHLRQLGIGVRRGGYMVGVSFAIEDGPKHYLPIRHQGGDNLDEQRVLAYLREQSRNFTGEIVGTNLSYDLDYLWEEEIFFSQASFFRDIQVADPLIYELHQSYKLQSIAERWGLPGKDEAMLREAAQSYGVSPKDGLWKLPGRFVGPYGEADAEQPLLILRKQEKEIDRLNLWEVWDMESHLLPILVKMRRRGVRINTDRLTQIEEWTIKEETEALALVKRETGYTINFGDTSKKDALVAPLQEVGVKLGKTPTGQWKIDQSVYSSYDHPVVKAIAWARKVAHLRTTFCASIRTYMTNGRIHCTFNQIARENEKGEQRGVRYGRLSSTDPNLQQQPSRDEFAATWRSIYIPEEGCLWGSDDYAQQEPKWVTHFAAKLNLSKARETAQAYRHNPFLDNHQFMAELTGLPRKQAKDIYQALSYGEGGAALCRSLGLPTRWALAEGRGRARTVSFYPNREAALEARRAAQGDAYVWETAGEEGQRIMDTFDEHVPFVRNLAAVAEKRAKQNGVIITPKGRRLNFAQRPDGTYDWTHKALNRLIQGTGADQMKQAMVDIDREMPEVFLQLQVHDELTASYEDIDTAKKVAEYMRNSIPDVELPFRVDVEVGLSWGELEKIE